jgi:Ca2+-binding RTX toxin-like protein
LGNDDVDGGGGTDVFLSTAAQDGVTVDLSTGTSTGEGNDTLTAIENLWGSIGADSLTGDAGPNELYGFTGNDRIGGAAGDDLLDGGPGVDSLDGGEGSDSCFSGETRANCESSSRARSGATSPSLWPTPVIDVHRLVARLTIFR